MFLSVTIFYQRHHINSFPAKVINVGQQLPCQLKRETWAVQKKEDDHQEGARISQQERTKPKPSQDFQATVAESRQPLQVYLLLHVRTYYSF